MLFLSLSFFLILSFSLFSFLSASYSTSIDDDGQQVNTRKNETKRKEEEGEIRGHEVLFFSFSPAKQQVLFGNEWRTSREKKREIGSKEKEVKMTATKKKPFKILYPGTSKFFSCIYLCRFIQPRKRRRRRRRRRKKTKA